MERKLVKKPQLKAMYVEFINEYQMLNHMTEIVDNHNDDQINYYLPHHHVLQESSSTTKVVFDGSCKSDTNISINDLQYAGPSIQTVIRHFN